MKTEGLQTSDYRIRKLIGILGLSLPIVLPVAKGEFLASISHYYYATLSSLLFIIIISAFGLFLISYKGYKKDATSEQISDDLLTNIGGLAALIIVFIPTDCEGSTSQIIENLCNTENFPLYGHKDTLLNTIHLISAGIFILCMGWMSKYKFTRGNKPMHNSIYIRCGNIVFISVGLLILGIILEKLHVNFLINRHYIYIFETIAVIAFGTSWLVKGEALENLVDFKNRVM